MRKNVSFVSTTILNKFKFHNGNICTLESFIVQKEIYSNEEHRIEKSISEALSMGKSMWKRCISRGIIGVFDESGK